jgi:hypothetical protein
VIWCGNISKCSGLWCCLCSRASYPVTCCDISEPARPAICSVLLKFLKSAWLSS